VDIGKGKKKGKRKRRWIGKNTIKRGGGELGNASVGLKGKEKKKKKSGGGKENATLVLLFPGSSRRPDFPSSLERKKKGRGKGKRKSATALNFKKAPSWGPSCLFWAGRGERKEGGGDTAEYP